MNTRSYAIIAALGLGVAAGALQAQTATEAPRRDGFGRRGPMGPPPELVAKYDLNQDGTLDETERATLRQDMQAGKIQPPGRPMGPRGQMGPPPEILEKYDANQDGTLDETERATLHKDMQDGKIAPPPGRRGPRPLMHAPEPNTSTQ